MTLLWMDLETTGLSPETCRILEVACILTDDNLREMWRCCVVTSEARRTDFTKVHPAAIQMHCDNGLWSESLTIKEREPPPLGTPPFEEVRPMTIDHDGVNRWLSANIQRRLPEGHAPGSLLLAGTTVHFDRGFVRQLFPSVEKMLSHRHLDVRAITELVARTWPALRKGEPASSTRHRAMPDIEHSLALAQYYRSVLTPSISCTGDVVTAVRIY